MEINLTILNSSLPELTIEAAPTVEDDPPSRLLNSFISSDSFSSTQLSVLIFFVGTSLGEFSS